MQLKTSVLLVPLLNPVEVAENLATLDHLCHGPAGGRRGGRLSRAGAQGSGPDPDGPRAEAGGVDRAA